MVDKKILNWAWYSSGRKSKLGNNLREKRVSDLCVIFMKILTNTQERIFASKFPYTADRTDTKGLICMGLCASANVKQFADGCDWFICSITTNDTTPCMHMHIYKFQPALKYISTGTRVILYIPTVEG